MVAIVIAYGVILFFLAGAAAAACAFYVHAQKRKLQSAAERAALEEEGKRAFCDVYGNGANTAFVLLNAVSMQPVFVRRHRGIQKLAFAQRGALVYRAVCRVGQNGRVRTGV